MLSLITAAHDALAAAAAAGARVAPVAGATVLGEIAQLRAMQPGDAAQHAADLASRITETLHAQEGDAPWTSSRPHSELVTVEHGTADAIAGPLLTAEPVAGFGYAEPVDVIGRDGRVRWGRVLEINSDRVAVQVLDVTEGLGLAGTVIRSRGGTSRLAVGPGLFGRTFDGAGQPRRRRAADQPGRLQPPVRVRGDRHLGHRRPHLTLVRGQKLPVFFGYGLPAAELAARIATSARVPADDGADDFVVTFAALGITRR